MNSQNNKYCLSFPPSLSTPWYNSVYIVGAAFTALGLQPRHSDGYILYNSIRAGSLYEQ